MISKLKLINLTTHVDHLDKLLNNFVTFSGFHPIKPQKIVASVHGALAYENTNPCDPLLKEIEEIETITGITFECDKVSCMVSDIDNIQVFIDESYKEIKEKYAKIKHLEQEKHQVSEALFQVENIEDLGIPFDDLFNTKYVALRFGKLPVDVADRLRFYQQKPFLFIPFVERDGVIWSLYITSKEYEREVDNIFTSMFYERIHIPDFVHGTPEKAREDLKKQVDKYDEEIQILSDELTAFVKKSKSSFDEVKGELEFLQDIYQSRQYVVRLGDRITLTGFIEDNDEKALDDHFKDIPLLEIQVQDAESDKRFSPPTKLKNNWFTKPFESFVKMYGVPSYHDVDPTTMMAITYSLLFGIMFGDFGQGLVLTLLGFIMTKWKKNPSFGIVTRIGLASTFFGLVYGETFGMPAFLEGVYHQVNEWFGWHLHPIHPMDNSVTMNLLVTTVGLGSVIILSVITINTITKLRQKKYADGLVSSNGLAGLLLYGFTLTTVLMTTINMSSPMNLFTTIIFIIIPIGLIFMKEPIERYLHKEALFPDGVGGFLIEGIFELFEVVLSYVTNTLSFLRVGGFVLSHAGMMLVVITLMDMTTGTGSILVAILGNLFVMALEGMIVGIQVLRLQFYEMFSRYFEGDGVMFEPRY